MIEIQSEIQSDCVPAAPRSSLVLRGHFAPHADILPPGLCAFGVLHKLADAYMFLFVGSSDTNVVASGLKAAGVHNQPPIPPQHLGFCTRAARRGLLPI